MALLRATCAGFALVHALGCAAQAPSERTVLAGNWARTLLILPLNVAAVMPPELEVARPLVWEELEIYLRAQGKELKTVSYPAARQLWGGAIRKVRAGENGPKAGFDDAARELVLELTRHAAFEAVIVPSLFVREARIEGQNARWDGVERPLDFEFQGRGAAASAEPPAVEGLAPAVSLHAVVLDAQGNKVQEELRGLDLLVGVRVTEPGSAGSAARSFEFATHKEPLANRAHVREGIAAALAPFLPPLPPESVGAPH